MFYEAPLSGMHQSKWWTQWILILWTVVWHPWLWTSHTLPLDRDCDYVNQILFLTWLNKYVFSVFYDIFVSQYYEAYYLFSLYIVFQCRNGGIIITSDVSVYNQQIITLQQKFHYCNSPQCRNISYVTFITLDFSYSLDEAQIPIRWIWTTCYK